MRQPVLFSEIPNPAKVGRLELAFCNLESLAGIHCLTGLKEISIRYCRSLNDISQLERLRQLNKIDLFSLPNVDVQFHPGKFLRLEDLSYTSVSKLFSIRGIEKLKRLKYHGLSRVKVLDGDYTPIVKCKSLKRVFWVGGPFQRPAMQEIRELRPDILIGGNRARPTKASQK